MPVKYLDEILHLQKAGQARGLPSICSAHPWVLKETLRVFETLRVCLIESTCNQVNQFGGYTGMTPAGFATWVRGLADKMGFPLKKLILGGDHLGPGPWQNEPAESAMQKAEELVRAYVLAGFTKIHLDASMHLGGDDPSRPLDVELSARRTARLAKAAEETYNLAKVLEPLQGLRYVIGTEVPTPGGATDPRESLQITRVADARCTFEATQAAFRSLGLEAAWERVIAMVVQPGVEFGDSSVHPYRPSLARHLSHFAESIPLVYEAHSTDYQTGEALRQLVHDHFAILKVGPALTFAFREAVFALAMMENELLPQEERSHLIETLESVMLAQTSHWQKHYRGTEEQMALARKYSLSDRIRYYWPDPQVQAALEKLLNNFHTHPIPLTLISQFLPKQYEGVRSRQIDGTPEGLIFDKIHSVLETYTIPCGL